MREQIGNKKGSQGSKIGVGKGLGGNVKVEKLQKQMGG